MRSDVEMIEGMLIWLEQVSLSLKIFIQYGRINCNDACVSLMNLVTQL
jgi:hypothetical protein